MMIIGVIVWFVLVAGVSSGVVMSDSNEVEIRMVGLILLALLVLFNPWTWSLT